MIKWHDTGLGNIVTSAAIAGAGMDIGYVFHYVGGHGSVQYLNDAAHAIGTAFQLGGLVGATAYFGLGIPHVLDRERELAYRSRLNRIGDINLDTATINAEDDRLAAQRRHLQNIQGQNRQGP